MSHSGSAHDPDSMPPAGFPVYSLDSPFPGPRWLELFGDPPDGAPTWVSLLAGLSFVPLRDGSPYHFNLREPLSFDVVRAAAEAAGISRAFHDTLGRRDDGAIRTRPRPSTPD